MWPGRIGRWGIAASLSVVSLIGASTDSRLVDAAKAQNRTGIRTLLKQGVNVNASQSNGVTALHWAAYQDDLETAELLIHAGANVKVVNRYGVTPLSSACESGDGSMVELLLKAGADPNTTLPGGETALMTAARTGKVEAIKPLLARGADVNAKEGEFGQTALMWAAADGNVQAVEALIQAGADIHARERGGFTPLLYAVRDGEAGVARALLKAGVDVNETIQRIEKQKKLADPDTAEPPPGTSALALAIGNGHLELAAILLDAGADPNAAAQGWTALHAITWLRKPGSGDNPPAPQGSGTMTSLELVKKLAEHGANLNARATSKPNLLSILNMKGATPFLLAARTADAELMRYLAQLGADPLLPNEDGSTPLMAAAGLGTRSPGEDAGTESEVVEALQAALDLGADINAVDKNGETAMHGAAFKNLPAAVQFLADKGAKIEIWNRRDRQGWTPLYIAQGHRFGNFKPSPETAAVFLRLMSAAGVSTVVEPPPAACGHDQKDGNDQKVDCSDAR